jgi:hypothetical protein
LIALVLALLYQMATRRFGWRVLGYGVLILAGFLVAEAVAELLGWNVTRFGDVRLLPDVAGAALGVAVLRFLGL